MLLEIFSEFGKDENIAIMFHLSSTILVIYFLFTKYKTNDIWTPNDLILYAIFTSLQVIIYQNYTNQKRLGKFNF